MRDEIEDHRSLLDRPPLGLGDPPVPPNEGEGDGDDDRDPEPSRFVALYCPDCSVEFQITRIFFDLRQKDHRRFHCPNGHGVIYKPPGEPKDATDRQYTEALQDQIFQANRTIERLQDEIREHERRLRAKRRGLFGF